jgi:GT2 family glycosyltransferase
MPSKSLLIIPSYISNQDQVKVLNTCVASLRATTDADLLIVDDGSPISEIDKIKIYLDHFKGNFPLVDIILKEENSGFSTTVNEGIRRALENNQNAVLVNADIEFREDNWLENMENTEADIVGALLLYPNLLIQHAGIYFSTLTRMFNHRFVGSAPNLPAAQHDCECPVTGALQFLSHEVIEDIGLYDENFKMGFEDVDYMIRAITKGHKSVYNHKVRAIHHESLFRGKNKSEKIARWERESLVQILSKYNDTDFTGIVPTEVE